MRSKIASDRARLRRYQSIAAVVSMAIAENIWINSQQPNSQKPNSQILGSWKLGSWEFSLRHAAGSARGFPTLRCRGLLRASRGRLFLAAFQRGAQTGHQINDFRLFRRVVVGDQLRPLALHL